MSIVDTLKRKGLPRAVPIGPDGTIVTDYVPPPPRVDDGPANGVAGTNTGVAQSKAFARGFFRGPSIQATDVFAGQPLRVVYWNDPTEDPPHIRALFASGKFGNTVLAYQERRTLRDRLSDRAALSRAALARYRTPNAPSFAQILASGDALSATGMQLGAVGGTAGQAVGAVGGLLAGLVLGVIPTERNQAESEWRALTGAMQPIDRYCLSGQLQPIVDAMFAQQGMASLGPFRWADDPPLGHSPYGGPVGRMVALVEILLERPFIPATPLENPRELEFLALYVACFAAGAHDDTKKLQDMRELWPRLRDGRIAPQFVDYFRRWAEQPLSELRSRAKTYGVNTVFNPPLTPSLQRIV